MVTIDKLTGRLLRRWRKASRRQDVFDDSAVLSGVRHLSVKGSAVSVAVQVTRTVLQTLSTVVLARLLTPEDFGLIAIASSIVNFGNLFNELGLSTATIQVEKVNHTNVSSLFWLNLGFGAGITAIIAMAAPGVSSFFDRPALVAVLVVYGTSFVAGGASVQHSALLRRRMEFGTLGIVQVTSTLVALAAAVAAALLGASYWALVVLNVGSSYLQAIGLWIVVPWRPGRPGLDNELKEMLRFGRNISIFNVVNYFSRNLDDLMLGKMHGLDAVGYYMKAYSLITIPIQNFRAPLERVAIPAMSRLASEAERFAAYYYEMVSVLAFVTMPLVTFAAVFADETVRVMLGPGWSQAAPLLRALAVVGVIEPVVSTRGSVLVSLGQSKRYLVIGVGKAAILCTAFIIGAPWGAMGMSIAYSVATLVAAVVLLPYSFRYSSVSVGGFTRCIAVPFTASLCAGAVASVVCSAAGVHNAYVVVALGAMVFATTYLAVHAALPGGTTALARHWHHIQLVTTRRRS